MSDTRKSRPLKSGELARAAGVSQDTLSHYEKLGLLPAPLRSASGYRLYPPDMLFRVQMIRSAVRAGFSLSELAEVLKERRAGGAPCRKVAEMGAEHLDTLNRRIHDLTRLRDWLAATLQSWESRLQTLKRGERAAFLESLPNPNELNSIIAKGNHYEDASVGVPRTRLDDGPRSRKNGLSNAPNSR
jgi:DNA-binding transcriptional MerR regulator